MRKQANRLAGRLDAARLVQTVYTLQRPVGHFDIPFQGEQIRQCRLHQLEQVADLDAENIVDEHTVARGTH